MTRNTSLSEGEALFKGSEAQLPPIKFYASIDKGLEAGPRTPVQYSYITAVSSVTRCGTKTEWQNSNVHSINSVSKHKLEVSGGSLILMEKMMQNLTAVISQKNVSLLDTHLFIFKFR